MSCRALITTSGFSSCTSSVSDFKKSTTLYAKSFPAGRVLCSSSSPGLHSSTVVLEKPGNDSSLTGGAYDFGRATTSLTHKSLSSPKKVTVVRHGLSTWNEEGRVQGSSNLSTLTETGVKQAEKCRMALSDIHFYCCFSSPISHAKSTAEVTWQDREQPLVSWIR